jgi:hypothetical protein
MSRCYVYAIMTPPPSGPLGVGLRDEPLTLVVAGDLVAAVGGMEEPPEATPGTIRGHDAIVTRLAGVSEAILPARFGMVQEATALGEWLVSADALREALRLVAGREQMTLHVFDDGTTVATAAEGEPPEPDAESRLGPGARYLERRRHQWRRETTLPELAPLRERLAGVVAAERIERRTTPPFRASVYHLIERGRSGAYRETVEAAGDLVAGVRLRVSGPLAPYAFAPALRGEPTPTGEPSPSLIENRP